jgi:hypothetical protein
MKNSRYLKLLLFVTSVLLFPQLALSQSVVQYTYDSGGNRISQIVPSNRNNGDFGNRQEDGQGHSSTGQLAGHNISISVLERQGLVKVEILDFSDSDDCQLSVFSTSGSLVATKTVATMPCTIDISHCRKGIYILQVILNGETGSWKIIKR